MSLLASGIYGLLAAASLLAAIPVGTKLEKLSVGGSTIQMAEAPATAVIFVSTTCPISNAYNERMSELYRTYAPKGIRFVFVNSNVTESPADIERHIKDNQLPFTVLKDEQSQLADLLGAQFTPEVFLFDRSGVLRYHGYIDDSRNPARIQVHGLRQALDALLAGREIELKETRAFGCTIKRARKAS
jgi:protein-disulfide isomerase